MQNIENLLYKFFLHKNKKVLGAWPSVLTWTLENKQIIFCLSSPLFFNFSVIPTFDQLIDQVFIYIAFHLFCYTLHYCTLLLLYFAYFYLFVVHLFSGEVCSLNSQPIVNKCQNELRFVFLFILLADVKTIAQFKLGLSQNLINNLNVILKIFLLSLIFSFVTYLK